MGLVECLNHNLVEPYDVIYEKDGEWVMYSIYTNVSLTKAASWGFSELCSLRKRVVLYNTIIWQNYTTQ